MNGHFFFRRSQNSITNYRRTDVSEKYIETFVNDFSRKKNNMSSPRVIDERQLHRLYEVLMRQYMIAIEKYKKTDEEFYEGVSSGLMISIEALKRILKFSEER